MVYATIQNAGFSFKIKGLGDYPRTLPWQMNSTFILSCITWYTSAYLGFS